MYAFLRSIVGHNFCTPSFHSDGNASPTLLRSVVVGSYILFAGCVITGLVLFFGFCYAMWRGAQVGSVLERCTIVESYVGGILVIRLGTHTLELMSPPHLQQEKAIMLKHEALRAAQRAAAGHALSAVEAAAKALGSEYQIEKITDLQKIMGFGVMMTPALVVDGVVKVSGRVPSADEIRQMLA